MYKFSDFPHFQMDAETLLWLIFAIQSTHFLNIRLFCIANESKKTLFYISSFYLCHFFHIFRSKRTFGQFHFSHRFYWTFTHHPTKRILMDCKIIFAQHSLFLCVARIVTVIYIVNRVLWTEQCFVNQRVFCRLNRILWTEYSWRVKKKRFSWNGFNEHFMLSIIRYYKQSINHSGGNKRPSINKYTTCFLSLWLVRPH